MSGKNGEGRDPESGNTARGDDTPPDIDETLETNTSSQSDPELIRGKILGDKYEILSHLGSGAMGAVYKARHQILNKEVAIKVLQQADLADKVKKERFIREAKAQGALNHKNIAAVHDFGLTEKDQPFFVMDLLKGQSLEEYLEKEKSLACFEACQIFEQVARALQHAHSKGIVHRDIKPSNIMLIDSEDGELNALLVDFGIAVHSEKELTKLTKQGHVVGTPHYMSPEQISGKPLDARSDIYSLGCVMFETLTGNLPFWGRRGVRLHARRTAADDDQRSPESRAPGRRPRFRHRPRGGRAHVRDRQPAQGRHPFPGRGEFPLSDGQRPAAPALGRPRHFAAQAARGGDRAPERHVPRPDAHRPGDHPRAQRARALPAGLPGAGGPQPTATCILSQHSRTHHRVVVAAGDHGCHRGNQARRILVVGMHHHHDVRAAAKRLAVAGLLIPAVTLVPAVHNGVDAEPPRHLRRVILGGVIHEDRFRNNIGIDLAKGALQCPFRVVGRKNDDYLLAADH